MSSKADLLREQEERCETWHRQALVLVEEKKFSEARELWAKASKEDHVPSMVCYGTCLLNGMGMPGGKHNGSKVGFGCVRACVREFVSS